MVGGGGGGRRENVTRHCAPAISLEDVNRPSKLELFLRWSLTLPR